MALEFFHIHSLFLSECGGEVLYLGGECTLDVGSGQFVVFGGEGGREGVRLCRRYFLDEGLTLAKVSCNVRSESVDFLFFERPVREAGKDVSRVKTVESSDLLLRVAEEVVHLRCNGDPWRRRRG